MVVTKFKKSRDSRYSPEVNYMALWALILGLPLWFGLLISFHLVGFEERIVSFLGNVYFVAWLFPGPTVTGGYIALVFGIAVCISSTVGFARLPHDKAWKDPGRAAFFFSVDVILLMMIWIDFFFNVYLFSLRNVLDHFALSLLVMIVGIVPGGIAILVLMDVFFSRLWRLFGYEDSIFNGQGYRRLMTALRNNAFRKDASTRVKVGLVAILLLIFTLSVFAYIGR
jgi:hypothetical protein